MKTIPAVLFVVAQRLRHERWNLDLLHIRNGALNAPVTRKVSQHLEAERHVPSPPLAWLEAFALTHLIRVAKLCR
jgi:hypothetical protein